MTTPAGVIAGLWLMTWSPLGGVPQLASGTAAMPEVPVTTESARETSRHAPASLLDLTDDELKERVESDPASLGSLTIGTPGAAILLNPVSLPAGPLWEVAPSAETWGTTETVADIQAAVDKVHELFPDTPPIFIGEISDADGGRLKRHESHQGGRDVDLGFYYASGQARWYEPGTAGNLDLARNWALVRALVTCTDVEAIFLDTRIQRLLCNRALGVGEDKDWLDRVFQFSRGFRDAIVSHIPFHRTHYHVRFYNPVAQQLGQRPFRTWSKPASSSRPCSRCGTSSDPGRRWATWRPDTAPRFEPSCRPTAWPRPAFGPAGPTGYPCGPRLRPPSPSSSRSVCCPRKRRQPWLQPTGQPCSRCTATG